MKRCSKCENKDCPDCIGVGGPGCPECMVGVGGPGEVFQFSGHVKTAPGGGSTITQQIVKTRASKTQKIGVGGLRASHIQDFVNTAKTRTKMRGSSFKPLALGGKGVMGSSILVPAQTWGQVQNVQSFANASNRSNYVTLEDANPEDGQVLRLVARNGASFKSECSSNENNLGSIDGYPDRGNVLVVYRLCAPKRSGIAGL